MSRIEAKFKELKDKGEGALITFVTAGDPKPELTLRIVQALTKYADIVELGIPFSDPIADGPTIQGATDRALKAGTNPETVLEIIKQIRRTSEVPLVLLTYYNIVFKRGVDKFMRDFTAAGMDGIVIPDLPIEEAGEVLRATKKRGADLILLVAPTTTPERLKRICDASSGFLYVVSLLGVTGARKRLSGFVKPLLADVRNISRVPIAVGFGISKPGHIREVIEAGADGAIVGSAFVNLIAKNLGDRQKMLREIEQLGKTLKAATRLTS